jgi:hypothetical protein
MREWAFLLLGDCGFIAWKSICQLKQLGIEKGTIFGGVRSPLVQKNDRYTCH